MKKSLLSKLATTLFAFVFAFMPYGFVGLEELALSFQKNTADAAGSGTVGDPFTSLSDAHGQTPGVYNFNISGQSFSTYVDNNGWVQVAIDFGNGTGNLPQGISLTNTSRGILNTASLAALSETFEARLSSSTGNFDVVTRDNTIVSRIQSNSTLHRGAPDNAINNAWEGTNAIYMTADASCTTTAGNSLHQNIVHGCGNTFVTHWIPSQGTQMERYIDGDISNSDSLHLWVRTASFTQSANTLTVPENAGTNTYTIVLESEPTSNVVIDLTSDDTNEGTVAPASLTFTPANWDTAQTVTVTGVDDGVFNTTDTGTITASIDDASSDDTYDLLANQTVSITYTDDDVDTTAPTDPTVGAITPNPAQTGSTVTVPLTNVEPGTTVTVPGMTCTPTPTDATGNVSCTAIVGPTFPGTPETITVTDPAGNTNTNTSTPTLTVDDTAPAVPTINPFTEGSNDITGTGEPGSTITLTPLSCVNAPILVAANGTWTCDNPSPEPNAGDTITAVSTDPAGNSSSGTITVREQSRRSGGSRRISQADLDRIFGNNVESEPILGEGEQCPSSQLLTQNMKAGDRNGQYSSWEGSTIIEVKILQAHMNRLGFASGVEDGILGPITDGAIKRMQVFLGTTPDGYVGPITRGLINSSCREATEDPEEVVIETPEVLTDAQCFINYTRLIKRGMSGNDVLQAQECVASLGHPTGPFDGIYGGLTYAGIRSYQQANNLLLDGIIGPETAGHLNALSGIALDGVTPLIN